MPATWRHEDGSQQAEVLGMARPAGVNVTVEATAEEGEVAKEVEHLVAHELVAVA